MSEPQSELERVRAQAAALERQAELEQAVVDAGQAYEADSTEENYAAHNRASEALADYRASLAPQGGGSGPQVGGDAFAANEPGSDAAANNEE